MTDFIMMSSTEAQAYIANAPAQCYSCGGVAPFGNGKHAVCLRCLYCCHRCGVMLPIDSDVHYCESCSEDIEYAAWDKTQP